MISRISSDYANLKQKNSRKGGSKRHFSRNFLFFDVFGASIPENKA